jgi:hypothetical protein
MRNHILLSAYHLHLLQVIPAPVPATPGQSYQVRLTVEFSGSKETSSSADLTLRAVGSPLIAKLKGVTGDVKKDKIVKLDATGSSDPDDPAGNVPLKFTWSCTREDFPAPCFSGSSWGDINGGRWELPASLLTVDKLHTFKVTVSKVSGLDTRLQTDAISITPRAAQLPIPTGRINRLCGKGNSAGNAAANAAASCPDKHNSDGPLSLQLKLDAGFEAAAVTWQSPQLPNLASTAGSALQLNLQPSDLKDLSSITVVAVMSLNGQNGTTETTVRLNAKPACRASEQALSSSDTLAAKCLTVETISDTYGSAKFVVNAQAYQDDASLL